MTAPVEKAYSLDDAIEFWNKGHSDPKDKLTPGSSKMDELGTNILIHHSPERGFWLEDSLKEKQVEHLHLLSPEIPIHAPHYKQLQQMKKTYAIAGQLLNGKSPDEIREIRTAQIQALFGDECAQAYYILMDPKSTKDKILEIIPSLSNILDKIKQQEFSLEKDLTISDDFKLFKVIVKDFNLFKNKALEEAIGYYKTKQEANSEKFLQALADSLETYPDKLEELSKLASDAQQANQIFKMFYAKLLDSIDIPTHLNVLQELDTLPSWNMLLEDLRAFQMDTKDSQTEEPTQNLLDAVIKDFEFAISILNELSSEKIQEAAQQTQQHLLQFPQKDGKPQGSLMLCGGFSGHKFLYKIELNEAGGKFSVINTGEGAQHIRKLSSKYRRQGYDYFNHDVVFSGNLNIKDLTPSFFEKLFNLRSTAKSMDEIFSFLDKSLLREGIHKEVGMKRVLQRKGTCVVRSVNAWLLEKFGKELFRKYDLFAGVRSKKSVEEIAESLNPLALQYIFGSDDEKLLKDSVKTLLEKGKESLQHKATKIPVGPP